jgi:penicillin amidase
MRRLSVVCLVAASLFGTTLETRRATSATQDAPRRLIHLKGLKDRVTISRDERGIPYIEARNDEDLYFAQGYATAADRLWQMDMFRRTERGELAEVLGAGPNNAVLDQDKLHRTYGFAQVAEAEVARASPQSLVLLEAYAKGVNAYAASLDSKSMPPEFQILQYSFRPWTPADSFLVVKIFFEGLTNTWRLDLMRQAMSVLPAERRDALLPEISPLDVLVVGKDAKVAKSSSMPTRSGDSFSRETLAALAQKEVIAATALARIGFHTEALAGSNNWVVSGKRTTSGKPLLSNDPHLPPTAPSIWHMVHLSAPGVRVAGVSTPGLPGVIIGHNDRIAWGITNVGPDVQDIYLEKFDPNNARQYQTPSGWQDAVIRHEEIKVRKGFTSSATDVVGHDVIVTRHGPIIFEGDGKRYALRWTAFDPTKTSPDLPYRLNRARNWKEFKQALESFTSPTSNVVYADVDGHIGYHAAGVVPIRKSGDGSVPYDGSADGGEWISYIPNAKLPNLFDPPSGIIVTANQRIVGTDYPYFLTHSWFQPYRARRIRDLLNEKPKHTAEDFRRILGDVYSIAGILFTQQTAKILRPRLTPADEKLRATIDAFEKWDGRINAESRVAPIAAQMRNAFRSRILSAALGPELVRSYQWSNFDTTLDRIIKDQPAEWLPKEFQSYSDLLRACYDDAVKTLIRSLGDDETKWTWGEMVKVRLPHPLAGVPVIGSLFSITPFPQNGTDSALFGGTINLGARVSMRLIADPGDWDKTQQGITLGESGLPKSPHWSDQLADWRAVTPREFPFSAVAVSRSTTETLVLEPTP